MTAEFKSRCKAFDFAVVAHAVLEIALEAKKKMAEWWKANRPRFTPQIKKPHQLVLELDSLAQIPMFKGTQPI